MADRSWTPSMGRIWAESMQRSRITHQRSSERPEANCDHLVRFQPFVVRAAGWVSRQFLAFLVKQSSSWLLSSKLAVRIFVVTASLPDREGCLPLTYRLQVLKNSAVVPAAAFATCFRRFFLRWWTSLLPYLLRNHDCLLSLSFSQGAALFSLSVG